jgi:hypothetical protein
MNTDAKRYYEVLDVDPSASEETIRVAFRRRAKELHPDAQSGDASAFILLKRAYDTLSSPIDRAAYDRSCQPAQRPIYAPPPRPTSQPRPMPTPPPPLHPKTSRRSGIGVRRYVIAFIIMAAISLGGIQAMISLTESPPSIQTRAPTANRATATGPAPAPATESPAAPGSTKSGFWDAGPTSARSK